MSDFPISEKYRNALSASHIRSLKENGWHGPDNALPVVIKKEKGAYLYDIDENKYTDFFMHDGTAIAGHNHRTLTQFIKNGISSGTSSGAVNKFTSKLVRQFRALSKFSHIAFFGEALGAFTAVIRTFQPAGIGVSSIYLREALKPFGAVLAEKGKHYGLVFYEPLDFDGKLEDLDIKNAGWTADNTCSVEDRTAFRFGNGFITKPGDSDIIIAADCIANGMDSAVVLSNQPVEGENLPVFKTVAILETLKYFGRNAHYSDFNLEHIRAKPGKEFIFRKNVFKILKNFEPAALLPYGIYIRGQIGFISTEHTEFDWKRLENSLEQAGIKQ